MTKPSLRVWVVLESDDGGKTWAVHDTWATKKAAEADAKAQRAHAREFFSERKLKYRVVPYVQEGE